MTCIEPNGRLAVCLEVTDLNATTFATILIAVLTFCVFVLQFLQHRHDKRVSNANYQLALYDKRLETYFAVRKVMANFFRDGQPSIKDAFELRNHAQTAKFLFPPDVICFLEEIATKAFDHNHQQTIWEPLRKRAFEGDELSEDEIVRKEAALKAKHEIEDWFLELVRSSKFSDVIDPHLKLPDSL